MDKRNIIGVGIFIALAFIIFFIFQLGKSKTLPAINAVAPNAICIFEINTIKNFEEQILKTAEWQNLKSLQCAGQLDAGLVLLKSMVSSDEALQKDIASQKIIAAAYTIGAAQLNYVFLTQLDEAKKIHIDKFIPAVNKDKPIIAVHQFEKEDIYEATYTHEKLKFSFAKVNGLFIYSTSIVLVENAVLQLKKEKAITEDVGFAKVKSMVNENANSCLYININQLTNYFSMFADANNGSRINGLKNFTSWIGIELHMSGSGIEFTGYAASSNSADLLLESYTGSTGNTFSSEEIASQNASITYTIHSDKLAENTTQNIKNEKERQEFIDTWSAWLQQEYTYGISETFDNHFENKSYVIIPVTDTAIVTKNLARQSDTTYIAYKSCFIRQLKEAKYITYICNAFKNTDGGIYYTYIHHTTLFSPSINELKSLIDDYVNGQTLKQDDEFNGLKKNMSTSFNVGLYINLSKTRQLLSAFISDNLIDSMQENFSLLQKFSAMRVQFSAYKDAYIIAGTIKFNEAVKRRSGLLWKAQIDAPIIYGPYLITNNSTKHKNIIVQDSSNQIYLISADGDVVWKKQLPGSISGKIDEVDFYANKKLQMLFSIPDAIYLIDINGNDVEGFPIALTSPSTNPLSVIDYNHDGNYAMFTASSNGNIYGFYKDGKPLPGWNPMKSAGDVTMPLAYARADKKDYVVYANTAGNIFAKSGKGENIFKKNLKSACSQKFELDNINKPSQFLNFDNAGNLITVDMSGNIAENKISEDIIEGVFADIDNDGITDMIYNTSTAIVAQTLQQTPIFHYDMDDASLYKIQTYNLNGQNYVGIYSNITSKIFLFDQKGNIQNGFPIDGSLPFVIGDLLKNGDKMLVTGANNMIYTYRIQ